MIPTTLYRKPGEEVFTEQRVSKEKGVFPFPRRQHRPPRPAELQWVSGPEE